MLSSKFVRVPIHRRGFSYRLRGGLNAMMRRDFATGPGTRSDNDGCFDRRDQHGMVQTDSTASQHRTVSLITREESSRIHDKDVRSLKVKINDIQSNLKKVHRGIYDLSEKLDRLSKKMDSKLNWLMVAIVGSMFLEGGFELYRYQRENARTGV